MALSLKIIYGRLPSCPGASLYSHPSVVFSFGCPLISDSPQVSGHALLLHHFTTVFCSLIVDVRAIGVIPIESRASGQVPFRRESPDVGNPLFRLKLFGQLKLLKMDMESFHQPHDCFGCFPRLPRMRPIDDQSDPANARGMRTATMATTANDFGASRLLNSCRLPARMIQPNGHRVVCTHTKSYCT